MSRSSEVRAVDGNVLGQFSINFFRGLGFRLGLGLGLGLVW